MKTQSARIAGMDWGPAVPHLGQIRYSSTGSLFDYDIVVWDPNGVPAQYNYLNEEYLGCPALDSRSWQKLRDDMKRRREDLRHFVQEGGTLVVQVPTPFRLYAGAEFHMRSAFMHHRVADPIEVNAWSVFRPFREMELVPCSGSEIECRVDGPLREFWNADWGTVRYRAHFKKAPENPFLHIRGTGKVVGCWFRLGNGLVILTPHVDASGLFDANNLDVIDRFLDSVTRVSEALMASPGEAPLPEWASSIRLPGEQSLHESIEGLRAEEARVQGGIDSKLDEIRQFTKLKYLIAGKGKELEAAVRRVLNEMGIDARQGPSGGPDIVFQYGDRVGVVEVKGATKSATGAHANQLEKWVADYRLEHDTTAKGLLMMNAFCDTPLPERTQTPFPSQVVEFSTKRDHCLVTTRQILAMYLDSIEKPDIREGLIRSLFETVGVFTAYGDFPFSPADTTGINT